jgi:hypothetical protein
MSQALKSNLTVVSLIVGICMGVFGFIQAFAVLPYRVEQSEHSIKALQEDAKSSREILIRIEERVKRVQEDIRK